MLPFMLTSETDMEEDTIIPILNDIQNSSSAIIKNVSNTNQSLDNMRSDMNLQFIGINEKLSGQFISEIELRNDLNDLRKRIQKLEKHLDTIP
jgi:hypothetical protein